MFRVRFRTRLLETSSAIGPVGFGVSTDTIFLEPFPYSPNRVLPPFLAYLLALIGKSSQKQLGRQCRHDGGLVLHDGYIGIELHRLP